MKHQSPKRNGSPRRYGSPVRVSQTANSTMLQNSPHSKIATYKKEPAVNANVSTVQLDLTPEKKIPEDLDSLPFYLRESIQKVIDDRVAERITGEMGALKDETHTLMAKQKEESRVKIEQHLKEISQREYDIYKTQFEVTRMMQQESEDLRKKIERDQKELKK